LESEDICVLASRFKESWNLKTGHFEDQKPLLIHVQIPPLEGSMSFGAAENDNMIFMF